MKSAPDVLQRFAAGRSERNGKQVYVLPSHQKQGCGTQIMNCLENEIRKKHDTALLDASLPAVCLYEHRGYKTVGHGIYELENDVKLVYEIMEKKLRVG